MKGYAATDIFTQTEQAMLEQATELVHYAPAELWGDLVRCHELARMVGYALKLPVVDGRYGSVEHSWLVVGARDGRPHILDVYAPGRLPQVLLTSTFRSLPDGRGAYKPGRVRDDINWKLVRELWRIVRSSICDAQQVDEFRRGIRPPFGQPRWDN